ncbi:MAG TPA: YlxR family protein [Candidatus Limnocylindria bacterium]|nr:YlxR family protein [Candidatus Limnocylindria bacterium]
MACRRTRPKRELVRVVRSPEGDLGVDLRGKANGRGAYVCPDRACLERGLAGGAIARALEVEVPPEAAARLGTELEAGMKERAANA